LNHSSTTRAQALLFKFIDFIEVKLRKTEYRAIQNPFYFSSEIRDTNIFIGLFKGNFFLGNELIPMKEGSFYFIPRRHPGNANDGYHENPIHEQNGKLSQPDLTGGIFPDSAFENSENVIGYVSFEIVLYNALPFFPLLELSPLIIPPDEKLSELLREIIIEKGNNRLGKDIILKNYTIELVVRIFRLIHSRPGFDKVIDKLHYLTDMRLIGIVNYIRENLEKELTNASIAKVAGVSDEYVGQFFKSLTGRTLQDYIEAQRMDKAMHLLKTIPNSIQEIAAMVGFKDAAYFSRRFRLHFKANANILRKEMNNSIGEQQSIK